MRNKEMILACCPTGHRNMTFRILIILITSDLMRKHGDVSCKGLHTSGYVT